MKKEPIVPDEETTCSYCAAIAVILVLCAAVAALCGFYVQFCKKRNYYESWQDYDNCGML